MKGLSTFLLLCAFVALSRAQYYQRNYPPPTRRDWNWSPEDTIPTSSSSYISDTDASSEEDEDERRPSTSSVEIERRGELTPESM